MTRVALYARVSRDDDVQDPEVQLLHLREEAQRRGWRVVMEYVDRASAADLRGRVEWRNLLRHVRRGGIDVVAVLRLDRAFRSSLDCQQTVAEWDARKIGFVSITQPFDTTAPTGKLLLAILAAVAEFERGLIVQRTKEGLRRAIAQGKRLGRPPGAKDRRQRKKRGYLLRYADRPTHEETE